MKRRRRAPLARAASAAAVLAAAVLAAAVTAQTLPNLSTDAAEPTDLVTGALGLRLRGYGAPVSPGGAVTGALRATRGRGLAAYLGLVEHFEDVVGESHCDLRDSDWVSTVGSYAALHGWVAPNGACSSSSREREVKLKLKGKEVYERLREQAEVVEGIKDAVHEATVGNFSEVVFPRSFAFEQGQFQVCTVERITALRVLTMEGVPLWYMLTGISNAGVTETLPDWDRQYVDEYVGVNAEKREFVDPLWQFVKPVGAENIAKPRARFATVFEQWGGRVGLSGIYNMAVDDSPALLRAIEITDRDVSQADDALTLSNIAILTLPMVMNLIPISCLTEVSSAGILVVTLLSDVLTAVPLIIKGFELVAMGYRRAVVEESWFSGRPEEPLIVLETWAAECRLKDVHGVGAAFLAVGFSVLLFGVFAEVQAARLRRRWTKNGVLVAPPKRRILYAMLGRDTDKQEQDGDCDPYFDASDEAAAFEAQQQAQLLRHAGKIDV